MSYGFSTGISKLTRLQFKFTTFRHICLLNFLFYTHLFTFSGAQDNTLSGYIGSSSDRSGSVDNPSSVSSGNISENGDSKRSSSIASEEKADKPVKYCPICKKGFTKVFMKTFRDPIIYFFDGRSPSRYKQSFFI